MWESAITPFLAVILGGFVTGFFTLFIVRKSMDCELVKRNKAEQAAVQGVVQAIRDEVAVLWERYQYTIGLKLEELEEGTPLLHYYAVTMDYFTVYNNNAGMIGRIPDADLRKLIIATYTNAKGLLDAYALNDRYLRDYDECIWIYRQTSDIHYQNRAIARLNQISEATEDLKKTHHIVKALVGELLHNTGVRS